MYLIHMSQIQSFVLVTKCNYPQWNVCLEEFLTGKPEIPGIYFPLKHQLHHQSRTTTVIKREISISFLKVYIRPHHNDPFYLSEYGR